jgi:hypothetical protein
MRHRRVHDPLLEAIYPLRAARTFMSWYFVKRHSGNVKNDLLATIFQHVGVVFADMGKVSVFESEGLVLTESADVAHTVYLHLVAKPLVDIPEVRGITVGKSANV